MVRSHDIGNVSIFFPEHPHYSSTGELIRRRNTTAAPCGSAAFKIAPAPHQQVAPLGLVLQQSRPATKHLHFGVLSESSSAEQFLPPVL
jgi:hypothetical protein